MIHHYKLPDGTVIIFPNDQLIYNKCKFCKKEIIWAKTDKGTEVPVNWDIVNGWTNHKVNCFTKRKR